MARLSKEGEKLDSMTYDQILSRLTTLASLTELPQPNEQAGAFTSTDRRSQYDQKRDAYIDWGANLDADGDLGVFNGERLVADLDGPGVVWRIWSAAPNDGRINFYVDGENTPVFSRGFKQFFEQLTDEVSPAGFPSLCPKLSGGYNSFIPIPFNQNLKITFSEGWGQYYHITYSKLPDKTIQLPDVRTVISRLGLISLANTDRSLYDTQHYLDNDWPPAETMTILPGETRDCISLNAPGMITKLGVAVAGGGHAVNDALQKMRLKIYWDDAQTAAVNVLLGEFFGSFQATRFNSLPFVMDMGRMISHWPMPYTKARIQLVNESERAVTLSIAVVQKALNPETAVRLMRFHSKETAGNFLNKSPERFQDKGDRWPDFPVLICQNTPGRFCGMHLMVENRWSEPATKPQSWWYGHGDRKTLDWWWGEGDEKFFVDGEKMPSTFGTGTEDYIGYAWAAEPPFSKFESAFANQTELPLDGNGNTSVSRYQIADNIPFQDCFEAYLEKYKPDHWDGNVCHYRVVPYWYQRAGTDDRY